MQVIMGAGSGGGGGGGGGGAQASPVFWTGEGGGGGGGGGAQGAPRNDTSTCRSLTTWTICDIMNSIHCVMKGIPPRAPPPPPPS